MHFAPPSPPSPPASQAHARPARSIILSGFMATGKSTVGAIVARELGLPFVDTDELLAKQTGQSAAELFVGEGEARFRDREAELVLPLLADATPRVIAFGGGTCTIGRVRTAALEAATVITLTASAEEIVARVSSIAERPNLGARSPLERTRDLLAMRRDAYGDCHASIPTGGLSPEDVAARVLDIARRDLLAMPLGARSYAVELTEGEPERLTAAIRELGPSGLLIVSDANVLAARGEWLAAALSGISLRPHVIELPPGEEHKTLATVSRIWDEALGRGIDRDALVIAFGGGVVGDLAGFAASTLLRGVRCVQIPTTLLSMVDSSVGGKTGFDHREGKNLLGAFFQPSRALIDIAHLDTLPARERSAGLAEVVKIAFACDAGLLASLEASTHAIARGDRAVLRPLIRRSVLAKIRVVQADEREGGIRALLNLGHTVGHALEALGGYSRWLHGEAVALGTVHELEATERLGLTPTGMAIRAAALFEALGLPTRTSPSDIEAAWPFVSSDKKRAGTHLKMPVVVGPGEARVEKLAITALRDALLSSP